MEEVRHVPKSNHNNEGFPIKAEWIQTLHGLIPTKGRLLWLKLHIAFLAETKEFLSQGDSKMSDWYDTNNSAAYEASVQESDDTIPLGYFMYSGSFLNQVRVQEQIKKAIEALRHAQAQKRKQKSLIRSW